MARFCSAHGAEFFVVVMPSFNYPFDNGYPLGFVHDAVARWATQDGYRIFDLLPEIRDDDVIELRVEHDNHPNELGHARMAGLMLPTLRTRLLAQKPRAPRESK